jgi:branched-chain amino acid transport system ATP-binding protein
VAIDFGQVIATGSPQEIVKNPKVIEAYIGKQEVDHAA